MTTKVLCLLEVGMGLLVIALFLYVVGLTLFFNRTFLLIANIFFLGGIYFFVGFSSTVGFFMKKGKRRGSALYFSGILLILLHFSLIGSLLQGIGVFLMFKSFIPACLDTIRFIPGVEMIIRNRLTRFRID